MIGRKRQPLAAAASRRAELQRLEATLERRLRALYRQLRACEELSIAAGRWSLSEALTSCTAAVQSHLVALDLARLKRLRKDPSDRR